MSDPLGISSALVDDLRAQVVAMQDALDMDRDEFARIVVLATSGEIQGVCARAMQRIERTTPLIRQHDELRKDYVALAADALNARQACRELLHSLRNPKFMAHAEKRAKEVLATELPDAFASERAAGVALKPSPAEEKYNVPAVRPASEDVR